MVTVIKHTEAAKARYKWSTGSTTKFAILFAFSTLVVFCYVNTFQFISSIQEYGFSENEEEDTAVDDIVDYQLAYDQSFGFFDNVPTDEWKIHQQIHTEYNKHKNPSNPLEWVPGHSTSKNIAFNSARAFYQGNYDPNFSCAFERRVGGNGNGDGPKWVSAIMYIVCRLDIGDASVNFTFFSQYIL